jgi:hypothetical protein
MKSVIVTDTHGLKIVPQAIASDGALSRDRRLRQ